MFTFLFTTRGGAVQQEFTFFQKAGSLCGKPGSFAWSAEPKKKGLPERQNVLQERGQKGRLSHPFIFRLPVNMPQHYRRNQKTHLEIVDVAGLLHNGLKATASGEPTIIANMETKITMF